MTVCKTLDGHPASLFCLNFPECCECSSSSSHVFCAVSSDLHDTWVSETMKYFADPTSNDPKCPELWRSLDFTLFSSHYLSLSLFHWCCWKTMTPGKQQRTPLHLVQQAACALGSCQLFLSSEWVPLGQHTGAQMLTCVGLAAQLKNPNLL